MGNSGHPGRRHTECSLHTGSLCPSQWLGPLLFHHWILPLPPHLAGFSLVLLLIFSFYSGVRSKWKHTYDSYFKTAFNWLTSTFSFGNYQVCPQHVVGRETREKWHLLSTLCVRHYSECLHIPCETIRSKVPLWKMWDRAKLGFCLGLHSTSVTLGKSFSFSGLALPHL